MQPFHFEQPQLNPRSIIQQHVNNCWDNYEKILEKEPEMKTKLQLFKILASEDQQPSDNMFKEHPEFQQFVDKTKYQMIKKSVQERIITPKIPEFYQQQYASISKHKAQFEQIKNNANQMFNENISKKQQGCINTCVQALNIISNCTQEIYPIMALINNTQSDVSQYKQRNNDENIHKFIENQQQVLAEIIESA